MPKAALVILCHKPLNNRTINAIPNFQITRFKIHIFSSVISVKNSPASESQLFKSFRVLEILSGFLFLVCLIIFTHVSIERCIHTPNTEEGAITDENSNISYDHITTGYFF